MLPEPLVVYVRSRQPGGRRISRCVRSRLPLLDQERSAEGRLDDAVRRAGGNVAAATDDHALARSCLSAIAGTAVDKVRTEAGQVDEDAQAGEPVVLRDAMSFACPKRLVRTRRESHAEARRAFRAEVSRRSKCSSRQGIAIHCQHVGLDGCAPHGRIRPCLRSAFSWRADKGGTGMGRVRTERVSPQHGLAMTLKLSV